MPVEGFGLASPSPAKSLLRGGYSCCNHSPSRQLRAGLTQRLVEEVLPCLSDFVRLGAVTQATHRGQLRDRSCLAMRAEAQRPATFEHTAIPAPGRGRESNHRRNRVRRREPVRGRLGRLRARPDLALDPGGTSSLQTAHCSSRSCRDGTKYGLVAVNSAEPAMTGFGQRAWGRHSWSPELSEAASNIDKSCGDDSHSR